MKIGDRVVNKKTSFPNIGTVVGIVDAQFFIKTRSNLLDFFISWNDDFPEWQHKSVVYVEVDHPQKNANFDEFCRDHPHLSSESLKSEYERIPEYKFLTYPIDDLQFEEEIYCV